VTTETVTIPAAASDGAETVIPAGARVQLRYGAANRDPQRYDEPGRFWIERPAPPGIRHIALGHGMHFCLGAGLARLEGGVVLEELIGVIPEWDISGVTRCSSAEVRGPATLNLEFVPGAGGLPRGSQ
jgi:cytochrome P450